MTASAAAATEYNYKGKDTTAAGRVSVVSASTADEQEDKDPDDAIAVTERVTTVHKFTSFLICRQSLPWSEIFFIFILHNTLKKNKLLQFVIKAIQAK